MFAYPAPLAPPVADKVEKTTTAVLSTTNKVRVRLHRAEKEKEKAKGSQAMQVESAASTPIQEKVRTPRDVNRARPAAVLAPHPCQKKRADRHGERGAYDALCIPPQPISRRLSMASTLVPRRDLPTPAATRRLPRTPRQARARSPRPPRPRLRRRSLSRRLRCWRTRRACCPGSCRISLWKSRRGTGPSNRGCWPILSCWRTCSQRSQKSLSS